MSEVKLLAALVVVLVAAWAVYLIVAPSPETARSNMRSEMKGAPVDVFLLAAPNRFDLSTLLKDFASRTDLQGRKVAPGTGPEAISSDAAILEGTRFTDRAKRNEFAPLDLRHIAAARLIGPQIQAWASAFDPQTMFGVPVFWDFLALEVDPDRVVALIDKPVAPDSLSVLFDPDVVTQLAECGVVVEDSAQAALGAALIYLGLDPYTTSAEHVEEAAALWELTFPNVTLESNLPANAPSPCVRLGFYGGDALMAGATSVSVPSEGGLLRLYFAAIPEAAQDQTVSEAFVEHLLSSPSLTEVASNAGVNSTLLTLSGRQQPGAEAALMAVTRAPFTPPRPDTQAGLKDRIWRLVGSNAGLAKDLPPTD